MTNWCKIMIIQAVLVVFAPAVLKQTATCQINVILSVPEIALIDIEPDIKNSISFEMVPADDSGNPPEIIKVEDQGLWLNYSSALGSGQNSRTIMAEITQGDLPSGISLFVQAGAYSGSGRGRFGQPAGRVQLTNQPRPVVSGIGSCFTGNGINNGHILDFSVEITDYSGVIAGDQNNYTVLYTITDN